MNTQSMVASIDAKALADRLAKVPAGEMVGYDELKQIAGCSVQVGRGHGLLTTARRIALRENRAVFRCVHNEGLRRLTDEEVTKVAPDEMRRVTRRKANRTVKELVAVEYDALPADAKIRHNVGLSMAGALTHASSHHTEKRLADACEKASAHLPVSETLALFGK